MDAFFASVEQRDHPDLRGKAIAVGGDVNRGVVSTASYEARKYGIHSAMSVASALRLCPNLILLPPNFKAYKEASNRIFDIFYEYTEFVEPLSIDEAFLDVSLSNIQKPSATLIAADIKKKIKQNTGLTASAGVSFNKFLAKVASDYQKPDGLFVVTPQESANFIDHLPIDKFFGIGKVTADKLHKLGVYNGYQLRQISLSDMVRLFGKVGHFYYEIVRGIDNRPVEAPREQKSIGAEETFDQDIMIRQKLDEILTAIADRVWERILRKKLYGRTVSIKVKFFDFTQLTRSKTSLLPITLKEDFVNIAKNLLADSVLIDRPVRLLGASISNFDADEFKEEQLLLNLE